MGTRDVVVAKSDLLKDGDMKKVTVGEQDILLCKVNGKFYAIAHNCPHYGAPLSEGVLHDHRVVCPWHHAAFDITSGDLLEPPALDGLVSFPVHVDAFSVKVTLPDEVVNNRSAEMVSHEPDTDDRTFVIVGAGAAGNAAAQTLREDGFKGRIVMISYEDRVPYDRPNLSKEYLQGEAEEEWMPLRPRSFYEDHGIELMTPKRVTKLEVFGRKIAFDDGDTMEFDRALLATGGKPRRLDVPNMSLGNIFTLRSFDDCDAIIAAAETASKVVVVGASFIGMETAFSLSRHDLEVTVVAPEKVPFENVFGPDIGDMFRSLHEEMGVKFRLGVSVERFEGTDMVEAVILEGGDRIEADLVIVGIGVVPVTEYIEGLELGPDGSIKVDEHMQAADNIYAAGDIARFTDWRTGAENRIEHWRTAEQQGRYAAHNMAGKHVEYRSVPFFWTAQAGLHFRYVGHAKEWDNILIDGDIGERDFIAYYVKDNTVLAAGGHGRDQQMDIIEELFRTAKMPDAKTLEDGSFDLSKFLNG